MNLKDRKGAALIVGFLVLVALLFVAAVNWLGFDPAPVLKEARILAPHEETLLLDEIERASASRSWSDVESARKAALKRLRAKNQAPGRGLRFYFFPEMLGDQSLESDISQEEIRPALESLRAAETAPERTSALNTLRSRVENYELGATTDEVQLSPEASRFLWVYEKLIR